METKNTTPKATISEKMAKYLEGKTDKEKELELANIHLLVERPAFSDPIADEEVEKISKPFKICLNIREYAHFQKTHRTQGLVVREVLHLPKGVKAFNFKALYDKLKKEAKAKSKGQ